MKIELSKINVSDRLREDLGDIDTLAQSLNELGLIEPIVLNQDNILIAGGRRLAAAKLLAWKEIDYVLLSTLDESHRKELELEENIRRKDMDWKEQVCAVAEIHKLKERKGILGGEQWGYRQTGELLGMSAAKITYALQLATAIKELGNPVRTAKNTSEALRILMKQKEDVAMAKLAEYTMLAVQAPVIKQDSAGIETTTESATVNQMYRQPDTIPLNQMLFNDDCIDLMLNKMEAESIDHVITDPPYGIDMDNLEQQNTGMINIDSVAGEHDVQNNKDMFQNMFKATYRVLKPNGFFVFFYDLDHHNLLQTLAKEAGYKVQRWPLTWIKTHTCINQAAQWNFTKSTEVAMVCRKGNATLVQAQPVCHFAESNDADRKILGHPFVKPFRLWKWILEAVALKGQKILDPFAGVGSSTKTVINCGYIPIAIEFNPGHYNQLVNNVASLYKLLTAGKSEIIMPKL
jgi:ParB family chromosome partitioning protein